MTSELKFETSEDNRNVLLIKRNVSSKGNSRVRRREELSAPCMEMHYFSREEYEKLRQAAEIVYENAMANSPSQSMRQRLWQSIKGMRIK